jgi:hypothetical protein
MAEHFVRIWLVALVTIAVLILALPRDLMYVATRRLKSLRRWLLALAIQRWKTMLILLWLAALIPIIRLAWLVRHYGVEVPMLDDWEMPRLIVGAHLGHLQFADLFAQQQEGRTVLPKLIFILSAAGDHWDVRDQMMLSVVICWLTAAGIFFLLLRSGLQLKALALCFWLAVLVIFSTAQFEVLLLASGFPSFLPALFIVCSLVTITTTWPMVWKFLICVALAMASSFTLPNGLLAWGLTFPILFVSHRVPRWRLWISLWLIACALCATIYFWDYHKPLHFPPFAPALSPLRYLHFILIFLGGGLAYSCKEHPSAAATAFGAFALAIYCFALGYAVRFPERTSLAKLTPWLALGAYSIGSAILAAMGRISYGPEFALASRYVAFSNYLIVTAIVLVGILSAGMVQAGTSSRRRLWIGAICSILTLAFLVSYNICRTNTLYFLRAQSAKTRVGRGAVLFSSAFDTSEVIQKIVYPPTADYVVKNAAALDELKLLRPRLVRTNHLSDLRHELADGQRASGACEKINAIGSGLSRASGWAVLNTKHRLADCVLLAYRVAADQEWIAFAMSDSVERRKDISRRFRQIDQLWSGWSATFRQNAAPAGAKLSFWAVDADDLKLYQLEDKSSLGQ